MLTPEENLANAVVASICQDYYDYLMETRMEQKELCKRTERKSQHNDIITNGEDAIRSFKDGTVEVYTDVDSDLLMTKIREQAKYDLGHNEKRTYYITVSNAEEESA